MEPALVATITTALTVLAAEVSKGAASEAGKDAWKNIKSLFKSNHLEPLDENLSLLSEKLECNPQVIPELLVLLKASQSDNVGNLVGSIDAEKVIVASNISGDIHM